MNEEIRKALEELAFACPFGSGEYSIPGMQEYENLVEDAKECSDRISGNHLSCLRKLVQFLNKFKPLDNECNSGHTDKDEYVSEVEVPFYEALGSAKLLISEEEEKNEN